MGCGTDRHCAARQRTLTDDLTARFTGSVGIRHNRRRPRFGRIPAAHTVAITVSTLDSRPVVPEYDSHHSDVQAPPSRQHRRAWHRMEWTVGTVIDAIADAIPTGS